MQLEGKTIAPRRVANPGTPRPLRLDGALFHTGPALSTSVLSLPLYYLAQTVAGSATFQAWVNASSAARALSSIYTPNAPAQSPLPLVIVDEMRAFSRVKIAGGARNYFEGSGGLGVWFRSSIPSGSSDQDAATYFKNQCGNVVSDMEQLAGVAGYLDIERIELVDGPYRPEEDEAASFGDFYEALFRVEYRSL